MASTRAQRVLELLASQPGRLFAVLDLARDPQMGLLVDASGAEHETLLQGEEALTAGHVGPTLVSLEDDTLCERLVATGWGSSWGVFVSSSARFRDVRAQLTKALYVKTLEGDEPLVFRFYDPRVARVFLPQANARQRATLFDEVTHYAMEDEAPERLLCFTLGAGRVEQSRFALEA